MFFIPIDMSTCASSMLNCMSAKTSCSSGRSPYLINGYSIKSLMPDTNNAMSFSESIILCLNSSSEISILIKS